MRDITISDGVIRLGQLLKLAGLVESGGDVKGALGGRSVLVNGEVETRRGRQLRSGDVVACDAATVRVTGASEPPVSVTRPAETPRPGDGSGPAPTPPT